MLARGERRQAEPAGHLLPREGDLGRAVAGRGRRTTKQRGEVSRGERKDKKEKEPRGTRMARRRPPMGLIPDSPS